MAMTAEQTCGWCKQLVEHRVMGNDFASTGVLDDQECPECEAVLIPFQTQDGVARIRKAGQADRQQGEPAWAAGAGP